MHELHSYRFLVNDRDAQIPFYVFIFYLKLPTCKRHGHQHKSDSYPEVVLIQFVSPDDEHDVLETRRELKTKINTQKGICASRSFTKNL